MISIDSYRASIGNFAFTAQQSLAHIAKSLVVGTVLSSNGLARLLRPAPFIALFIFFTFAFPKSFEIVDRTSQSSIPVLNFPSLSRNGLFVPYPSTICDLSDPLVIFITVNCTLLLSGDVELNPGPVPVPTKYVQGSFNQGDVSRFGLTAGIQCCCNTIVSIIYSKCKQINFWKTSDLDYILIEGDKHFKTLGFTKSPFVDQFPRSVFVENQRITLEFETLLGEFVSNDIAINFIQEESLISSNGALFVI